MAITLRDIAKHLNLSHATVSFVLNERHDVAIPASTRQRVMDAAREMGYRPNRAARALVMGRTQMLAVWIPSPDIPFYGEVFDCLYRAARAAGYEILYCMEQPGDEGRRPIDWPVDGVLAVDVGDLMVNQALPANMPVVSLGSHIDDRADHVRVDLAGGAVAAVMHLLDRGCQRIAHVTIDSHLDDPLGRNQAYQKVVRAAGKTSELILCHLRDREAIRQTVREYIQRHGAPDGLFVFSDWMSVAVLRALADEGIRVPQDCRLVSFDGVADTSLLVPSLSTVQQPIDDMCRLSVEFLIQRIGEPNAPVRSAVLPPELVIRESTA